VVHDQLFGGSIARKEFQQEQNEGQAGVGVKDVRIRLPIIHNAQEKRFKLFVELDVNNKVSSFESEKTRKRDHQTDGIPAGQVK
jgi:hypothetical protein